MGSCGPNSREWDSLHISKWFSATLPQGCHTMYLLHSLTSWRWLPADDGHRYQHLRWAQDCWTLTNWEAHSWLTQSLEACNCRGNESNNGHHHHSWLGSMLEDLMGMLHSILSWCDGPQSPPGDFLESPYPPSCTVNRQSWQVLDHICSSGWDRGGISWESLIQTVLPQEANKVWPQILHASWQHHRLRVQFSTVHRERNTSTLPLTFSNFFIPGQFVIALMQDLLDRGHVVYTTQAFHLWILSLQEKLDWLAHWYVGFLGKYAYIISNSEVKAWRHERSLVMAWQHEKKRPVCLLWTTSFGRAAKATYDKVWSFVCYKNAMGVVDGADQHCLYYSQSAKWWHKAIFCAMDVYYTKWQLSSQSLTFSIAGRLYWASAAPSLLVISEDRWCVPCQKSVFRAATTWLWRLSPSLFSLWHI